ncbi:hypothetical protein FOZ63_030008 [Perkinsus olseni]|uniref:Uncharacterized protein n=1 Tax=Perkinsus olseni TaxID=32597 RepID=A0A7J6RI60_PEROL|nr:hypothetical protein FOZ63_030008 [Perkinsus olseni]
MKTPYGVALATLSLWASLPAASAVRASAADSGSLKAKYNITKMTHGNSCIAVGPQFTWQFELLKGTLRTLSLHCPDSEFHMVADPPWDRQGDSDLDIVTDPPEYVQRAASIERLGITYETTDFYNGSTVRDPLKSRNLWRSFFYDIAQYDMAVEKLQVKTVNDEHALKIAMADDDHSVANSDLKDLLLSRRVSATRPLSDDDCWTAAENVYDVIDGSADSGLTQSSAAEFTTRLCSKYREEIFGDYSTEES